MIFALTFFLYEITHPFVELVLTRTQHVTTLGVIDLIEVRSEEISGELDLHDHVMDEKKGVVSDTPVVVVTTTTTATTTTAYCLPTITDV